MTLKKPHYIRTFNDQEATKVDENFNRAYTNKIEGRFKRTTSGVESFVFQSIETGEANFSGTGSPTVALTFALAEPMNNVLHVNANAQSTLVTAHVTDVTNTSITITARTVSGTADFGDVTTAVLVQWMVIGSNP